MYPEGWDGGDNFQFFFLSNYHLIPCAARAQLGPIPTTHQHWYAWNTTPCRSAKKLYSCQRATRERGGSCSLGGGGGIRDSSHHATHPTGSLSGVGSRGSREKEGSAYAPFQPRGNVSNPGRRRVAGKFHAWKAIPRVRIFILGHPEFEYAVYLCSRCAWICVCRLQRCTAPTGRCAPLKSAGVDPSTARAQVPLVRRVSNDWRPVTVDRCRSSANGRESLVGPG